MTFDEDYRRHREFDIAEQPLVNGVTLRHLHFEVRMVKVEAKERFPNMRGVGVGMWPDPRRSIRMKILVADRDNGMPLDLIFSDAIVADGLDANDTAHWIKRAIMRAFAHELDEYLFKDGVLIHDPHADEPPR